MNKQIFRDILFLDIETVAQYSTFEQVPVRFQHLWQKKSSFFKEASEKSVAELYEKAGIYAEFGKIIVIAVGYFVEKGDDFELRIKGLANHEEKALLEEFKEILTHFDTKHLKLCAHNGKEFDFPYLSRRMLVHNIELPEVLDQAGKKPWEVPHIDTMELWKFGDYKHFTSLDLLAALFDIETSKDDIDGSMVNQVYYKEKNLSRINKYCKNDIRVLAQVYLHLIQAYKTQITKTIFLE